MMPVVTPTNLNYLQAQCGALVGNGTGGGLCNCPAEWLLPRNGGME